LKDLLDTNTCVQFLRHGVASPVARRLAAATPGDVVLCSVVVAELLFGALQSRDVAKNLADVRSLPIPSFTTARLVAVHQVALGYNGGYADHNYDHRGGYS
jgi:predicted nucleic acid-binding protein